jgi:hypothetical protein
MCVRLFCLHFHVPPYCTLLIHFIHSFIHSFLTQYVSHSLYPHRHLTPPLLTLPHLSPPLLLPSHLSYCLLTLPTPQLAHTRPLSVPLWTMKMVPAECWILSSATSTVVEKRGVTATSTKTTSRHLGSSPSSYSSSYSYCYSCSYSYSRPTFKASR